MKPAKYIGLITLILLVIVFAVNYAKKSSSENLTEANSVPVYFVKSTSSTEQQPVTVRRKIKSGDSRINVAVAELLSGPTRKEKEQGYYSEIPENTRLIGINESSDKVVINISKNFESGGGSESMSMRLRQLTYTAVDNSKNKPVYLELDGKKVDYIGGEGVEVQQPLSKTPKKQAS